jgi:hypothetical protein
MALDITIHGTLTEEEIEKIVDNFRRDNMVPFRRADFVCGIHPDIVASIGADVIQRRIDNGGSSDDILGDFDTKPLIKKIMSEYKRSDFEQHLFDAIAHPDTWISAVEGLGYYQEGQGDYLTLTVNIPPHVAKLTQVST